MDFGFPGFAKYADQLRHGTDDACRRAFTTTYTRSKPSTLTVIDPRSLFLTVREREEQFCNQDWRRVAGNVRLPEVCMTPCTRGVTFGLVVVGKKNVYSLAVARRGRQARLSARLG